MRFSDVCVEASSVSEPNCVKRATIDWAFVFFEHSFDMSSQMVFTAEYFRTRRVTASAGTCMYTGLVHFDFEKQNK